MTIFISRKEKNWTLMTITSLLIRHWYSEFFQDEVMFVVEVKREPGHVATIQKSKVEKRLDEKIKCTKAARQVVEGIQAELERAKNDPLPDPSRIGDLEGKLLNALGHLSEITKSLTEQ